MNMLFGLEDKIELFKKLIKENNLRQSYLFFGEPQTGKFAFAGALINFLETGEFTPPTSAPSCLPAGRPLIDAKFFAPDESGSIGIDEVRELKRFLYQRPINSSYRSAIFDSADSLTPEAQNALLKIIEEPPQFSLIIFIAVEPSIFPSTLASRFVKVYFPRLKQKLVAKYLEEKFRLDSSQAALTAKQSFGRIGRAIDIIEHGARSTKHETENLNEYLEEIILSLRKNLFKNSSKLSWLLEREELIKRYNLNPKLQFRAIQQKIHCLD